MTCALRSTLLFLQPFKTTNLKASLFLGCQGTLILCTASKQRRTICRVGVRLRAGGTSENWIINQDWKAKRSIRKKASLPMPCVPAKPVSIILLTLEMPAFVRRSVSIYWASLEEKTPFKVRWRKVKNREITYYSCSETTAFKNRERCKAFIHIPIIPEVGAQPSARHSWFKPTVTQQKPSLPRVCYWGTDSDKTKVSTWLSLQDLISRGNFAIPLNKDCSCSQLLSETGRSELAKGYRAFLKVLGFSSAAYKVILTL